MAENFNVLTPGTPDPIVAASMMWPNFSAAHPGAVNLTIGVIADPNTMRPHRPAVVQRAYAIALEQADQENDYGYPSPAGNPALLTEFGSFAFGPEYYAANRDDILAYQTMGGTGALWMTQEILSQLNRRDETGRVPLLLEPGYVNHRAIFSEAQFNTIGYPRVDPATGTYNHPAALDAISSMPPHSALLLQVCGHNDDGADRTKEQWDEILDAAQSKEAVVVLDGAYIGLARGLTDDTYPLVESARRGMLTFACLSGSKIMGLYGERLGAMYVLNARQHLGDAQFNNLNTAYKANIRRTITGVPSLVARAGAIALQDPEFAPQLEATRQRIRDHRMAFSAGAGDMVPGVAAGWGLYARARTDGFSPDEITALNAHGLHVLPNSRMNFGGMRDVKQAAWIGSVIANVLGNR